MFLQDDLPLAFVVKERTVKIMTGREWESLYFVFGGLEGVYKMMKKQ